MEREKRDTEGGGGLPSLRGRPLPQPFVSCRSSQNALVSGMTYNGVGLRLERCQLGPQGIATCEMAIDNNSLTEEPGPNDSEQASIVAALSAPDKNSILIANSVYKFALKLPDPPTATSYTNLPLHLTIPPHATTIRVAVRDSSGWIGTTDLEPSQIKRLITQHR